MELQELDGNRLNGLTGNGAGLSVSRYELANQIKAMTGLKNKLTGLGAVTSEIDRELNKAHILYGLGDVPELQALMAVNPYIDHFDQNGNMVFYDRPTADAVESFLNEYKQVEGLGELGKGLLKKIADKVKTVAKKATDAVKEAGQKVVKAIVKYNPLTIAARNGLLLLLRANLFGYAGKLAPAVKYTNEEANAKGYDSDEFANLQSAYAKLENMFTKVGGNAGNLKSAILNSKAGKALGIIETATITTAAAGFIAAIKDFLKSIDFKKLVAKLKDTNAKSLLLEDSSADVDKALKDADGKTVNDNEIPDIELDKGRSDVSESSNTTENAKAVTTTTNEVDQTIRDEQKEKVKEAIDQAIKQKTKTVTPITKTGTATIIPVLIGLGVLYFVFK